MLSGYQPEIPAVSSGELACAPNDGVERGGCVAWRAANNPQHLCHGGLLVERLGDLAVPVLQLVEEAGVLDRYHRLVGEGLDQSDLARRELADVVPRDHQYATHLALARERGREEGAVPEWLGGSCGRRILASRLNYVDDVQWLIFEGRSPRYVVGAEWARRVELL